MLRGVVRVRRVVRPPRAAKNCIYFSTNAKLLKKIKEKYLLNLLLSGMVIVIVRPSET